MELEEKLVQVAKYARKVERKKQRKEKKLARESEKAKKEKEEKYESDGSIKLSYLKQITEKDNVYYVGILRTGLYEMSSEVYRNSGKSGKWACSFRDPPVKKLRKLGAYLQDDATKVIKKRMKKNGSDLAVVVIDADTKVKKGTMEWHAWFELDRTYEITYYKLK